MAVKRKHSQREHHVYDVLQRALAKRGKHYSEGHVWAMVMGMAPKTLHKTHFKTTPRQYSITGRRAAAARAGLRIGYRSFPR